MGGICGWVSARFRGQADRDGADIPGDGTVREAPARPPDATAAPTIASAMASALAHRGGVERLDPSSGSGRGPGPGPVVADAGLMPRDAIDDAWRESEADPVAFANRLRGSFAVAALDRKRGRLVLVRDRLGEKPLYWTADAEGIAFASEIKALRAAGLPRARDLRPEAVDAYIAFTCIPAPWTIFRDVHKIPAGHCVVIDYQEGDAGRPAARAHRYWSLPESRGHPASPEEMRERLSQAVARRLPAGDRAAIFLSGGLDSSVVASLASRHATAPPLLVSCGFDAVGLDESSHARQVARLVGGEHRLIRLGDYDADTARRVIAQLDEPMADAATLPAWILARDASRDARVILTGDGADALLAGDHWFRRLRRIERIRTLPSRVRGLLPPLAGVAGRRRHDQWSLLVRLAAQDPARRYLAIRLKWTDSERLAIYSEAFGRTVDVSVTSSVYTAAPVGWDRLSSVDAAIRLDATFGLPEGLLMKADKMCSAHGCDSRSPFLDQEFVEWAARLATPLHLRGASSKDLLKRAAASLLPRELVWRRKQGFRTPMRRWLKGTLSELVAEAFSEDLLRRQGMFDPGSLARLKAAFDAGPGSAALDGRMWQIVAFQTWWRQVFG